MSIIINGEIPSSLNGLEKTFFRICFKIFFNWLTALAQKNILYSGYFSGGKIFVDMEHFLGSWKKFVVTCTRALMGVARCIYGNCFVGKYFVVCFSTMKTTKF